MIKLISKYCLNYLLNNRKGYKMNISNEFEDFIKKLNIIL